MPELRNFVASREAFASTPLSAVHKTDLGFSEFKSLSTHSTPLPTIVPIYYYTHLFSPTRTSFSKLAYKPNTSISHQHLSFCPDFSLTFWNCFQLHQLRQFLQLITSLPYTSIPAPHIFHNPLKSLQPSQWPTTREKRFRLKSSQLSERAK